MNRRHFLWEGFGIGASATLATGGFLFLRRNQARADVTARFLNDALPPLATKATKELQLPVRAREQIRAYFDGKCLNVTSFVSHICSPAFGQTLGRCRTQQDREDCLLTAFCYRVASEAEILNQVEVIATEVGSELDLAWGEYSTALSTRWNAHLKGYGAPLTADSLAGRVNAMIRADMEQVVRDAATATEKPALGETIGNIGKSAVLLLPVMRFGKPGMLIAVPVFVALAAKHIWNYVLGQLEDRRSDFQRAISARIALLGNRVGAEFEREISQRLRDLHAWQEASIRATAGHLAEERVGLI